MIRLDTRDILQKIQLTKVYAEKRVISEQEAIEIRNQYINKIFNPICTDMVRHYLNIQPKEEL